MGLLFTIYHHFSPMTGCKGLLGKVILDTSQEIHTARFKMCVTGQEDTQRGKKKLSYSGNIQAVASSHDFSGKSVM